MMGDQPEPDLGSVPLPDPIMVVHNRYQQRAGEDAEVDAEVAILESHGHRVIRFLVDNRSIRTAGPAAQARLAIETIWSRRAARQIAAEVRRHRPQIVHVHNTLPLLSPAIYASLAEAGAAIVQSIHNYRFVCPSANLFRDGHDCTDCVGRRLALPAVVHACYRDSRAQSGIVAAMLVAGRLSGAWRSQIDVFIAPSRTVAAAIAGPEVPAGRIVVKPNCLMTDPGSGGSGPREDAFLYAGRLAPEKGIETIVNAWPRLAGTHSVCRIAGSGPLDGDLARAAASEPRLEALGTLDRPALFAEMRRARALIFPSIWREPFGLTIIEAFASGTPVIAARLGAPAEIVDEGVTGLLFTPGDPTELAASIDWASGHPAEMAEMGQEARRTYEERYTAGRAYQGLLDVYRSAISARRARPDPSRAQMA